METSEKRMPLSKASESYGMIPVALYELGMRDSRIEGINVAQYVVAPLFHVNSYQGDLRSHTCERPSSEKPM